MMEDVGDWAELPSVVLHEVYKYLPLGDRLRASSISTNWRAPVFQTSPYKRLDLRLANYEVDAPKVRFMASHFVHKVPEVSLTFNAANPSSLELVSDILALLESNTALRTLNLRCTDDSLSKELFYGHTTSALILRQYFVRKVLNPLSAVLRSRNSLQTLSFPLIEEMGGAHETVHSTLLRTSKVHSLRHLFLPTLPTPPRFKPMLALPRSHLPAVPLSLINTHAFVHLQMLSVDQSVLSDGVLSTLGINSQSGGLKRLTLIAFQGNPAVSNTGWTAFTYNNPACDVRLTLLGGGCVVAPGAGLLYPAMRITHFRALYCKELRMTALNSLILWNESSLLHLELVNENYDWMESILNEGDLEHHHFLDPIIYAAWRCPNLANIKIGFMYCGQNLVGIARLKGSRLRNLEIPKSQVIYHNIHQLSNEVSKALSRPWTPVQDLSGDGERGPSRSQALCRKVLTASRALLVDEN